MEVAQYLELGRCREQDFEIALPHLHSSLDSLELTSHT